MLSLAKAAKDYYLQKLGDVSPREDYYLRGGTATGRWRGSGAADLGLDGTVTAEGLVRLFDGQHPGSGEQLGRRLRKDGVAAWDVTFSADKSVSLLWALGDADTQRQVLDAFDHATTEALGYLESVASSTRGARKVSAVDELGQPVSNEDGTPKVRVETWPIATAGYVAASFTEFTSRADDPQLHTHVVVANKVRGVDGIWRTLDGRLLYRHQLAAGYLHEAVLRGELTRRLGVRWQPVHNGVADIEGFTRDQIEAFSRRRHQLEAWRRDHDMAATAAARQAAVLATRDRKTDHPLDELAVEWRRRAAEVGLTPERIATVMGRSREVTNPATDSLFETLASLQGLTAHLATFSRAEVVKETAAALPTGGTRNQIETLADEFIHTRDVVPLLPSGDARDIDHGVDQEFHHSSDDPAISSVGAGTMRRRDGTRFPGVELLRYTTAGLLSTEQRVIDLAMAGIDAGRWTALEAIVRFVLRRHPHLTDDQRDMVRSFATSGNVIDIGVGPAGTGKTAVMATINQLANLTATPIVGAALAGKAAAGLETATGIPSSTLTRLIGQSRRQGGLPTGAVVVIDEAGMVGTRQLAAVCDLVEQAHGKLILTGDDRQLPAIDAGGLFRALANRLPTVTLTDNIRQRHTWERDALAQLRDGSPGLAMEEYRRRGRLIVAIDPDHAMSRAAGDWYRHVAATGDLTSGVLIGYDNDTVAQLNQRARTYLSATQRLHGPTLDVGDRSFQAGDRILCRRNQQRLDVLNGDLGTVLATDPDRDSLTVRLDRDPETRDLPSRYLDHHADYGYALTGHKAQGVTTEVTFTVMTAAADREWVYVAMSRGRQANTLYLTDHPLDHPNCAHIAHPQPGADQAELAAAFGRSSAQVAAIDHATRHRPPTGHGIATLGRH